MTQRTAFVAGGEPQSCTPPLVSVCTCRLVNCYVYVAYEDAAQSWHS